MGSLAFWHRIMAVWVSGVLLCLLGCGDKQEQPQASSRQPSGGPRYGGIYHRPLREEPLTLDPALISNTYAVTVVQQIFDGLVQFDADLNVLPCLAHRWNASLDGRVWTFHLRQGVTFHHGREVIADDVVYSLTRVLTPQLAAPRARLFEHIHGARAVMAGTSGQLDGVRALDRYTVEITLSQPYVPFLTLMGVALAKVVPHEEAERLGTAFGRHPVGTGPFRFIDWETGKAITLEAYEHYFEGRPFVDRVQYHILPNPQAMLAEFEYGQLTDATLPAEDRTRLIADSRFQFIRKPFLATIFLWINTREGPLSQRPVRQAINYAIHRDAINQAVRNNSFVQARGILPLGMPGHNPELPGYPYDVGRAKQLLAEAGYPDGKGIPPLELWSGVTAETVTREHDAIKHNLEEIGLTVELRKAENWKQFQTTILGQRSGALYRYAWFADFPDPDSFLSTLFHSQGSANYAHYTNPAVDQLLEQARQESNEHTRIQLYRQAETQIMADAPTVNLVYYTLERLFQPYVRGIQLNALGEPYMPLKKIWLDTAQDDPRTLLAIP